MSRSSGETSGGGASARTKLGSSTPSGDVPQFQQTSNEGSTLLPHFGQVHMAGSPGLEADRVQQLGRRQDVSEVEAAEECVPGRAFVEPHRVDDLFQVGRV